jgi:hypothetical protein
MAQPTVNGTVHVIANTNREEGTQRVKVPTAAGIVSLMTRNRWPALVAVTREGRIIAVNAYGTAAVGNERLMNGKGLKMLLSLDREDLRRSAAVLVAPLEPGWVELPTRGGRFVAAIGEFHDGRWTTMDRLPLEAEKLSVDIDADRATCLVLVCPATELDRWTTYLTRAMLQPDRIPGY